MCSERAGCMLLHPAAIGGQSVMGQRLFSPHDEHRECTLLLRVISNGRYPRGSVVDLKRVRVVGRGMRQCNSYPLSVKAP